MISADSQESEPSGEARTACREFGWFLEQRKNIAARRIALFAGLIRMGADWVEAEAPSMARAVHRRAERLERKAQAARGKSLATLEAEFGQWASERPFAFAGWGVLAGFLLARKIVGRGC